MGNGSQEIGKVETTVLKADQTDVERAAALLCEGQLVAFPTDTVYGVGTLFSSDAAVERIYLAKDRPEEKGIPILLADAADLPQVAIPNVLAAKLAAAFWPGPLTLILPKTAAVPPAVSRTATVAVRVPDHPLALALIAAAGAPLAVTSANLSGHPPTTDPAVVQQMLGGRIAAILDGGLAPGGTSSTIVDCTVDPPRILRPGPISANQILVTLTEKGQAGVC